MPSPRPALFLLLAAVLACNETTSNTTGAVDVTLAVSGLDPDPDGYQLMVDGTTAADLAVAGSVTLDLTLGRHTVTVSGLAANCVLQSPVVQEVTASQDETARVNFSVVCGALTGVVKVTAATTGLDTDPDGYQITSDGGTGGTVAANGTSWISGMPGGARSLTVGGLAGNCHVTGSNPVNVNVSVGGLVRDTVQVSLAVTCTAATGVVQVTTVTTGPDPDPDGYAGRVDVGPTFLLTTNGVGSLAGISGGPHSVQLEGLASNCSVTGSNPASVNIAVGGVVRDTARITFNVACTKIPPTGADFVVTTTGTNLDDQYHVVVYASCDYYCTPAWEGDVPANGSTSIDLPADTYFYSVTDIALNCDGSTNGSFDVTVQHVTSVPLAYTCLPSGTVNVDVHASGEDVQNYYGVTLDGTPRVSIAANGHIAMAVFAGAHTIGLTGVTSNCTVAAPNPVPVTITNGATVNVSFTVTCVANPTLRVTVATTGANAPADYLVGVDPDYYYGYQYSANIPANGTVSLKLPSGLHFVTLDQVPTNCSVTSANNVSINLPPGTTTDLAFTVLCR